MTGRGQGTRGSSRATMLMGHLYPMDSPRRGRGRPRKFPLSAPPQIPNEDAEQSNTAQRGYEETEEGDMFYQNEEIEDNGVEAEHLVTEDHNDLVDKVTSDATADEKMNQIQHQKMLVVNSMGQRRGRGRPNVRKQPDAPHNPKIVSKPMDSHREENIDMIATSSALELVEDESEKTDQGGWMRTSRARQPSRKLIESRLEGLSKTSKPKKIMTPTTSTTTSQVIENSEIHHLEEPEFEETVETYEDPDDRIEPLLPKEAHIEEPDEVVQMQQFNEQYGKKDQDTVISTNSKHPIKASVEKQDESNSAPPPAPKHLLNKSNCRGRPAVPPHRLPVPKDIVPPGIPVTSTTRRNTHVVLRDSAKRKERTEISKDDSHPPPLETVDEPASIDTDVQKPQEHVRTSEEQPSFPGALPRSLTQKGKKKERESGKDLPLEHLPKQNARHVLRAGLMPSYTYAEQHMKNYEMPMHDTEVMMHEEIVDQEGSSQQRVILADEEFIEERIEGTEIMTEDEMKPNLMHLKASNPSNQYIVEENGVDVVYEFHDDVIDGEERVREEDIGNVVHETVEQEYVIDEHLVKTEPNTLDNQHMSHTANGHQIENDVDDDDDLPPQLVPEEVQDEEVVAEGRRRNVDHIIDGPKKEVIDLQDDMMAFDMNIESGQTYRLSSPGGRSHEIHLAKDQDGNMVFIDENGVIVELVTDNGHLVEPDGVLESEMQQHGQMEQEIPIQEEQRNPDNQQHIVRNENDQAMPSHIAQLPPELRHFEFNFLDSRNISCGLCGEVVLYESLVSEHFPTAHPDVLTPGVELEEIPYENWLKHRLKQEIKQMSGGFRNFEDQQQSGFGGVRLFSRGMRTLRKVSQIRVNPNEMSVSQLEVALKRKMIEKIGRKVPVTLVDRLHARCDICQAVVSLNKKFEVIHLVRHFNAWHPAEHRCTNSWKSPSEVPNNGVKVLSLHDFAVVDVESQQNNLQCIWCGMFMDRAAVGMHFTEVHGDQVDVPKCSLCLQEMVMSARLLEKFGEDFGISLPDEFHIESHRLGQKYSSEKALDKAIDRYLKRLRSNPNGGIEDATVDDEDRAEENAAICTTNSQQSFGKRNRLKRKFVKPCFRQICPINSQFFEALSACHWRCKLCDADVYGAVISAGAIKHYKEFHPSEIEKMQYELVKARLERIGDGSMEFVHPQLVECLICNLTYALHKPFNICRAIRHLRLKHPEVMPETAGKPISGADIQETTDVGKESKINVRIDLGEVITDPVQLERFRRDHDSDFDKVQVIYGVKPNNEPSYILLCDGEVLDKKTAQQLGEAMMMEEQEEGDTSVVRMPKGFSDADNFMQELDTDEMGANMIFDNDAGPSTSSHSVYRSRSGQRPAKARRMIRPAMVIDEPDNFPQQIVEGEEEIVEMDDQQRRGVDFIPTYDSNGDMIPIDENEMMNEEGYEIIQEQNEYPADEDNRVQYVTEEELREAQARGDIQIEYDFDEDYEENNQQ